MAGDETQIPSPSSVEGSVELGPLSHSDLDVILSLHQDSQMRAWTMGYRLPVSSDAASGWLTAAMAPSTDLVHWAVRRVEGERCLGYVSLRNIDFVSGTAELGIAVADRGRGVGAQALSLVLQQAKDQLHLRKIHLRVVGHNVAARRFYERHGFQTEGCLQQHYWDAGGYHDVHLLARFLDAA